MLSKKAPLVLEAALRAAFKPASWPALKPALKPASWPATKPDLKSASEPPKAPEVGPNPKVVFLLSSVGPNL